MQDQKSVRRDNRRYLAAGKLPPKIVRAIRNATVDKRHKPLNKFLRHAARNGNGPPS